MNAILHRPWLSVDEAIRFAARHSLAFLVVLSIAAAVLSGIYVAATALATTMAATFTTQETASHGRRVQVATAAPGGATGRAGGESTAERNTARGNRP